MGKFIQNYLLAVSILLVACDVGVARQINVETFGASVNNEDNSAAFQKCLIETAKQNCSCYVPSGTYRFKKHLFFVDNASLVGMGSNSILFFSKGGIRGMKNGSNEFYYTNNYNNEIVPNEVKVKLLKSVNASSRTVQVSDPSAFVVGDEVLIFNGKRDSWTILEDSKRSSLWNKPSNNLFAQGGSFKVSRIKGNSITFTDPIGFNVNSDATLSKRAGVRNVKIDKVNIQVKDDRFAILLEQPLGVSITNSEIHGNGGVMMTHYAKNCNVENNTIKTKNYFAVSVENFSTDNKVLNNRIGFTKNINSNNGDAAIIILMGSYRNLVKDNKIKNTPEAANVDQDFGGVFVHALCYDNRIEDNIIYGAAEGIGSYYGAHENTFLGNKMHDVRIGVISYFARNNTYNSNQSSINYKSEKYKYGILDFGSITNSYRRNTISGSGITYLMAFQSSKVGVVSGNRLPKVASDMRKKFLFLGSSGLQIDGVLKNNDIR